MKKNILLALFVAVFATACSNDSKGTSGDSGSAKKDNTGAADTARLYACPMHPEVTGKKTDKCSQCGMELTKAVSPKGE